MDDLIYMRIQGEAGKAGMSTGWECQVEMAEQKLSNLRKSWRYMSIGMNFYSGI